MSVEADAVQQSNKQAMQTAASTAAQSTILVGAQAVNMQQMLHSQQVKRQVAVGCGSACIRSRQAACRLVMQQTASHRRSNDKTSCLGVEVLTEAHLARHKLIEHRVVALFATCSTHDAAYECSQDELMTS